MKYYVVSDVHGFFDEMKAALEEKGFFSDDVPHKLIVCGDMMDRGGQAVEMQEFMMDLLHKDELIFVRGNHEDLMIDMSSTFIERSWEILSGYSYHVSNGTFDTAMQLAKMDRMDIYEDANKFVYRVQNSDFMKKLIPASVDYFETKHHIFVHGWIPCETDEMPPHYRRDRHYKYNPEWRVANAREWGDARWFNGMELAKIHNIIEKNKTIVCGHWHASYGHSMFGGRCDTEFGENAIFTPYMSDGILAIDACTAHSGFVNCVVIEDEEA